MSQISGGSGKGQNPRRVERRLLVMRVEPELLEKLSLETGGANIDLPPLEALYTEDFRAVSHTFTIRDDGVGLLSVLFERPR